MLEPLRDGRYRLLWLTGLYASTARSMDVVVLGTLGLHRHPARRKPVDRIPREPHGAPLATGLDAALAFILTIPVAIRLAAPGPMARRPSA